MHDKDKETDKETGKEDSESELSQIPLLNEIVFDSSLPLKASSRPDASRNSQANNDHGPDYDPDTQDLFEDSAAKLRSFLVDHTEEELRAGASQVIENLVDAYSAEIIQRLRNELTDQLHSILQDLGSRDE